jgi:hypothetical protein
MNWNAVIGFAGVIAAGYATGFALVLIYRRAFKIASNWRVAYAIPMGPLFMGSLLFTYWVLPRGSDLQELARTILWILAMGPWYPAMRRAYLSRARRS